jgi:hypothetical protein
VASSAGRAPRAGRDEAAVAERPAATDPPGSPRYALNRAMFDLARAPNRRALIADKAAFLAGYGLDNDAREALLRPDWRGLLELGALPNLVYRYYVLHGFAPETFAAAAAGRADH